MTLYARGYRPYEGPRDATRFPFLPIQREGARLAMQGRAFRIFFLLSAVTLVVFTVLLYAGVTFGRQIGSAAPSGMSLDEDAAAAEILQRALFTLQSVLSGLGEILVLFVGAGLVADDLKARALPLYLVRPVRPIDYWLGKLLVPVRVLALTVLVPGLLLILVAGLFQPSDRMLPFLWARRELVAAVLAHFAYVAVVWSSVALFVSTVAQARVAAIILGAVIFFAGGIPHELAQNMEGATRRLLEAVNLHGDGQAVFAAVAPDSPTFDGMHLPEAGYALGAGVLWAALGAFVVLRRARTVEVVA